MSISKPKKPKLKSIPGAPKKTASMESWKAYDDVIPMLESLEPNILEKQLNDDTAGYLRTKIADRIEIRHTPKIRFQYDKSIEYGNNIERLLNEIHEKDGE